MSLFFIRANYGSFPDVCPHMQRAPHPLYTVRFVANETGDQWWSTLEVHWWYQWYWTAIRCKVFLRPVAFIITVEAFFHNVKWAVDVTPYQMSSITYASPHDWALQFIFLLALKCVWLTIISKLLPPTFSAALEKIVLVQWRNHSSLTLQRGGI